MSRTFLTAVAVVALSVSSAFATSTPLKVTLAAPATKASPLVGSIVWKCDGTSCVSANPVTQSDAGACRALSKAVGKITSFTSSNGPLSEAELAKCNGS